MTHPDTPDWYKLARDAAKAVIAKRPKTLPGIRPLEDQLHDAIADLETHGKIDANPRTVAIWDEGCDTAEAIAETASRIATIAHMLVIERVQFRADMVAEEQERKMSESDVTGTANHQFIK